MAVAKKIDLEISMPSIFSQGGPERLSCSNKKELTKI